MGIYIHHVVVVVTLLFTWFLSTRAKTLSDVFENRIEKEFPLDLKDRNQLHLSDIIPNLSFERPFRSAKMEIQPRATRVGENLFSARGYGKRSSKTELALLSARRFGKRNEERNNTILCVITKCKNYSRIMNVDEDIFSILERRDKELPEELIGDED